MSSDEKRKRKTWTKREISGLLKCYLKHKDEFLHSRKKRFAYKNVLDDMLFEGYTDENTTIISIEGKMKTLFESYKAAKDNNKQSSGILGIMPYMNDLEKIFGDKSRKPIEFKRDTNSPEAIPTSLIEENTSSSSPTLESTRLCSTFTPSQHSNDEEASTSSQRQTSSRKSTRKNQITMKMKARKAEYESKRELKIILFEKMQRTLEENFKAQQEMIKTIEEKKIKLLESFLKKMERK